VNFLKITGNHNVSEEDLCVYGQSAIKKRNGLGFKAKCIFVSELSILCLPENINPRQHARMQ
jgi:hypothetical protein